MSVITFLSFRSTHFIIDLSYLTGNGHKSPILSSSCTKQLKCVPLFNFTFVRVRIALLYSQLHRRLGDLSTLVQDIYNALLCPHFHRHTQNYIDCGYIMEVEYVLLQILHY